jgi:hypothetical protein
MITNLAKISKYENDVIFGFSITRIFFKNLMKVTKFLYLVLVGSQKYRRMLVPLFSFKFHFTPNMAKSYYAHTLATSQN